MSNSTGPTTPNLLPFQRQIITELISQDSALLILSRGLGLQTILSFFVRLYSIKQNLVLVINLSSDEEKEVIEEVACFGNGNSGTGSDRGGELKVVTNEVTSEKRAELYLSGGVISITSRILIVDMLNGVLPVHLVTGIIVAHAEKVTETSTESFILRIFRQENKEGFIKAFSDCPESFVSGFMKLEKMMKNLFLRTVYIWPRFHVLVSESLEASHIDTVELYQPLTESMREIQTAIIDCLDACLGELKRANPSVVVEEMTVENAMFKSFDALIRQQLDPIWHKVSYKTKQLVGDMKILRKLLGYLVSYDCVTFYCFLETILASNNVPNSNSLTQKDQSPWLFLDSANTLFTAAKARVFRRFEGNSLKKKSKDWWAPSNIDLVLEEQPKWELLRQVLEEIEETSVIANNPSLNAPVLIMVAEDRTCTQLRDYLSVNTESDSVNQGASNHHPLLTNAAKNYFKWKGSLPTVSRNIERRRPPPNKRRRVRGASASAGTGTTSRVITSTKELLNAQLDEEAKEMENIMKFSNSSSKSVNATDTRYESDDEFDPATFNAYYNILPSNPSNIIIHSYTGEPDTRLLYDHKPRFIVIYDPNPDFVRRVECYRCGLGKNDNVRVYFLVYKDSVEEQKYLSVIRKEKDAFERIVREKSVMALPIDHENTALHPTQDEMFMHMINSRIAGGQNLESNSSQPQIVVDMREFRSSLPSILHSRGIKIIPRTIVIGDYVLSPAMCVERKSVSDLIGSLGSGRLYSQAESMCLHYKMPILLIEFDQNKAFSLNSTTEMKSEISISDISSKLVLLLITFPQLKVVWSSSPWATAEIFEDLKKNQEQPDPDYAALIGVENTEEIDSMYNICPQDILRTLPGITSKNYKMVMNKVESVYELSHMSLQELQDLIGIEPGKQLYDYFNCDITS
ncbi:hypothetical protein BKA69DRAFT_1155170 [Paraphysoderma sedebokerense]|nr:hypothetical protein BKA69DRAFT_1155170 [Paraphysoderma sedebokerense]